MTRISVPHMTATPRRQMEEVKLDAAIATNLQELEDIAGEWQIYRLGDLVEIFDGPHATPAKAEEKRKRIEQQQAALAAKRERQARIEQVKSDLFSLFGEQDAHKRGKALESVLNALFGCYDILVREAFTIKGACGEGIIEQIDGLIEVESHLYLVELKWWSSPIGVAEIAPHLVRVFNRGGQARGLFISYSDFTDPAISQCRDAMARGAVVVLATLQEIVALLNKEADLKQWLKAKVNAAVAYKQPFLFNGG